MFLIFDTDTTGLPRYWNAPLDDFNNWPRLVKIAWRLYNIDGELLEKKYYLVKPVGFVIPKVSEQIHGVNTEIATKNGYYIKFVLHEFNRALKKAQIIIAHNIEFDNKIIGSEMIRASIQTTLFDKKAIDTKIESTSYCALPNERGEGYKWPTLQDLHIRLFRKATSGTCDIVMDVKDVSKCFFELVRLRVIDIEKI